MVTLHKMHKDFGIKYPLARETINQDDIGALIDWLKTEPRLTMAELTKEFERKWADYIGTKYSVYVNSGSSAILLTLAALKHTGRLKNNKIVDKEAITGDYQTLTGNLQIRFAGETDSASATAGDEWEIEVAGAGEHIDSAGVKSVANTRWLLR